MPVMIKHSKYLQYYDTFFGDLTPNKVYRFVGTFSGWCINPIRLYESYSIYETHLLPVMVFHNVKIGNTEPYTVISFKFKRCLTGTHLKIGDKLTFNCKLRKYIKGGLYSGDLLVNNRGVKNLSNGVESSTSRQLSANDVLRDLILKNSQSLYMYSLISTNAVSDIIKDYIFNVQDMIFRNSAVSAEVSWIFKILPEFPGDFIMRNNELRLNTSVFYDKLLRPHSINIIKTVSKLNKSGHLITDSQMRKMRLSHKCTTVFYILLRGLKRAKLFESKSK